MNINDLIDLIREEPEILLPDGLYERAGLWGYWFNCISCGKWTRWEGEIEDFVIDDPHNMCGGSPRCCP